MESNGNGTHANGSSREAARQLVTHARTLVQLELELAKLEVMRKVRAAAVGAGAGAAAALFAGLMVIFALAGAAAGIATVLPVWAALLIVAGGLLLLAMVGGVVALASFKKAAPPVPGQAIEEARRTKEAVQRT